MAKIYEFSSGLLSLESIDKVNGIIRGVAVITKDVTAKGHNLEVDEKTLLQLEACATKMGKVPVKWNHKTGADAVNGYLENFSIKDGKLKADWHLLKTHKQYDHAIELAERMPEGVGLSAAFRGQAESRGLKKFARCNDLVSVDLVATPAANPDGLFSAGEKVDTSTKGMANTKDTAEEQEFSIGDVMQGISAIQQNQIDLSERIEALEEFGAEIDEEFDEEVVDIDPVELAQGDLSPELVALNERLEAQVDAREQAENETMLAALEERIEQVVALNSQLALENQAMAEALHEFSAGTAVMASTDHGDMQVHLSDAGELSEFESRVEELKSEGKDAGEAVTFAVKEDPQRYTEHLQSLGALG